MRDRIGNVRLRKWIASRIGVAATKPEAAAVQVVASRLRLDGHNPSYSLAEFSIIILQVHLGFGDGVKVRVDDDNSKNGILVIGAVQLVTCSAEVLTVYKDLLRSLRVLG